MVVDVLVVVVVVVVVSDGGCWRWYRLYLVMVVVAAM